MKNKIIIAISVFTLLFANSCKKESAKLAPIAGFSYTGANSPAPSSVSFSNNSTNATSYTWDFGDNGSSTEANPQHLFTSAGVYTVKLTAVGDGGSNSISKTVNIGAALTKVKITKITVVAIPFLKPGGTAGWDSDGTGPDIYFKITDKNSTVLFDVTSSNRMNDVTNSSLPFFWSLTSTPFIISDLTAPIFIDLFDYDTTLLLPTPEYMGWVGFTMTDYKSGISAYPSSVTQTMNGITIKLDLTWY
jgi:PKD repeat protein